MAFSYANPASGPSAGAIGWFDFGPGFTITPNQVINNLSGTLSNGDTVTFDMTLTTISGLPASFTSFSVPIGAANFGNAGYTGMSPSSFVGLLSNYPGGASNMSLLLSNIVVRDPQNNILPNYTGVVVDAQTTTGSSTIFETQTYVTTGGNWQELIQLGNTNVPTLTLNGQTATLVGNSPPVNAVFVLTTSSPSAMALGTSWPNAPSTQGIAFGFATTHVRLEKNIAGRIDPADQFTLNVNGTPSGTATTTGTSAGIQTEVVDVSAIPGNTYTINEAMAPGSVSVLADYTQIVSAANATPAGSVPPVGNLPVSFTPALGDDVTYTILNVAPETFTKTVDKAFADIGDILTYTITVNNPNNTPALNVLVTDPTPAGTSYVGNISSNLSFTGADLATGITFPSIPANGTATLSWQVQVNTAPPVPIPVVNVGSVNVPGGTSGNTNAVTTQVNTAFIGVTKSVDKGFANVGDILTYTLTLNNAGNVAANNVVLTDAVPAGTSFVPGSVVGATGTPPTLSLLAPLAAGASTTVSFQVQVDNAIPNPNPIPNAASVAYNYTVDPANPNGASRTADSNTVNTQVNAAIVSSTKTADKAFAATGEIITYTINLNNSGNVPADNVVLTDAIPAGTTFVAGSVTGATGTPPTLTLLAPIPAGGSATVTFQVQVGDTLPVPNPVLNSATAEFTYTVNPGNPDGATGSSTSTVASTQVNAALVDTVKTVDKAYAEPGDVLTYTLAFTNSGNVPADNVVITDAIPAGTSFVAGSVTGATGAPPTLTLSNPIPANGAATVTFQVIVDNVIPAVNPIPNSAAAAFTFTSDPANPDGSTGTSNSNTVNTLINKAIVTAEKTVTPSFTDVGGTVAYTITLTNSGNVAANNVVLTDVIPAGTTFVPGSLVGATGTPPTLTLANPIAAGGTATVTFDVLVGNSLPNPNPLENSVSAAFAYTVDPAVPNGATGTALGGPAATQVNTATLVVTKSVDKPISYIGDILTYQISVKNTGNVSADNVVLTDLLPTGVSYVAGSLVVSVPYSGTLASGLALTNPIAAGQIITLSFQAKIDAMPNPSPVLNQATAAYTYTVDPAVPDGVSATASSPAVSTIVFRNNFGQQISDLIESVALEQAALAAIANAEGAKIQKLVAMNGITAQELLCVNKSMSEMMDAISMLESVLSQKLKVVDCQINGTGAGCM